MNVQRAFAVEPAAEPGAYVPVNCPARALLHFIDRSTGKLLGGDKSRGELPSPISFDGA
jgi:hypothetical protein